MSVFTNWMSRYSNACTAFQIKRSGDIFVGKNYDWIIGDDLLIVNKRGVSKKAVATFLDKKRSSDRLVSWVSKYGSVTHNPLGREFGMGGINETGLVIEGLSFPDTKTHKHDARPSISALQFVQYLLDNCNSVKEVIDSEKSLRIRPTIKPGGHLFIADKSGNCAVIEYINGKRVYYADDSMPYKVLTNSGYQKSVNFVKKNKKPWRDRAKSFERFITTEKMLRDYEADLKISTLDYSFRILRNAGWMRRISIGKLNISMGTRCSFVYDISRLQIHFRTNNNQNIRIVDLKSFDFTCSTPVKILDINSSLSGDVTEEFTDYTPQINNDLVKAVFKKTPYPFFYGLNFTFFYHLIKSGFKEFPEHPSENIETLMSYPETTICVTQEKSI
ncbi:MAG: linear amide C-N hydrolase [Desulfobacterales bacterium]